MLVTTAISPLTMFVEFEPPAKADLDDRPFAPRLGENDEGGGGQKIEPGRVGRRAPGVARGLVGVERRIEGARERSFVHLATLEAYPFSQPLDVRGGVASDAKAGSRERGLDQR